jgi:hypothetical protein
VVFQRRHHGGHRESKCHLASDSIPPQLTSLDWLWRTPNFTFNKRRTITRIDNPTKTDISHLLLFTGHLFNARAWFAELARE